MIEFIVRLSPVILLGLEFLLLVLLFAARSVKVLRGIEWSLCTIWVLGLLFFAYFGWVFRDPWSIFGTRPSEGAVVFSVFLGTILVPELRLCEGGNRLQRCSLNSP
jgi:hypothetical protein